MQRNICVALFFFFAFAGIGQSQHADTTQQSFDLSGAYTADLFSNLSGGWETGTRYMDNIDLNLKVNVGAFSEHLRGITVYLYGLGNQGGSISNLAGDVQGISNIETINSWKIYEFWAQKRFLALNSSILVGLYDINTEFDVLNSSLMFINSSHGINPTLSLSGVTGPSTFPYTSLTGRIKMNPVPGIIFKFAVLDGIPSNPANPRGTKVFLGKEDGLLFLAEISKYSMSSNNLQFKNRRARLQHLLQRGLPGEDKYKFALGVWTYTKKRSVWALTESPERNRGLYGLGEYKIYSETKSPSQGVTVFGRAAITNEMVNRFSGYLGTGIVYTGPWKGRDQDQAGIAVAHAINSSEFIEQEDLFGIRPEKSETNIEFTYLSSLSEWLQLQGNLQYVINPGSAPGISNALVVGGRLILSF